MATGADFTETYETVLSHEACAFNGNLNARIWQCGPSASLLHSPTAGAPPLTSEHNSSLKIPLLVICSPFLEDSLPTAACLDLSV